MSTEQRTSKTDGQATGDGTWQAGPATRAVSMLEQQAARGATALSRMAYRTADQIDHAADYLQKTTAKTMDTAKSINESAGKHVVPLVLAATALGFGICYLTMRKGRG